MLCCVCCLRDSYDPKQDLAVLLGTQVMFKFFDNDMAMWGGTLAQLVFSAVGGGGSGGEGACSQAGDVSQ